MDWHDYFNRLRAGKCTALGCSGGAIVGPAKTLAYFDIAGQLIGDPLLTAVPLDQFGRPQIRDIRFAGPPGSGPVFRQGAWQADGDPQNVTGEGIVIYGPAPNGLQNPANGTIGRMKYDRFAIRLIIGGFDVGYGYRTDLTESYYKDDAGSKTFQVVRATGAIARKESGLNAVQGLAIIGGGGTVTVPTTSVTAASRIFLSVQDDGPVPTGAPYVVARVPGASFTMAITGGVNAGVLVAWQIMDPA